jgi:CheY-like chemotaxis protein
MTKDSIHILLAEDDSDDRFFFSQALKELNEDVGLTEFDNGEDVLNYLIYAGNDVPDLLFLDLHMPRKNDSECLAKIRHFMGLEDLPVVVYSTSLYDEIVEHLYLLGATHYIRKTTLRELKQMLSYVLKKSSLAEHEEASPR